MAEFDALSEEPHERGAISRLDADFLLRIEHYLSGVSTDDELDLIKQDLSSDPLHRDAFVRLALISTQLAERFAPEKVQMDISSLVALSLADQTGVVPLSTTRPAPTSGKNPGVPGRWRGWRWVAIFLSAMGLGIILYRQHARRLSQPIAELVDTVNASWNPSCPLIRGQKLPANTTLSLSGGLAEITLTGGTSVLIQGPAQIRLESPEKIACLAGQFTVKVGRSVSGRFVVVTPSARVQDLGTEFGVNVQPDGDSTFEVFQGQIVLTPAVSSSAPIAPTTLRALQGATVGVGSAIVHRQAISIQFVRSLDQGQPASNSPPTQPTITTDPTTEWVKYEQNPVLGENLGVCHDVAVVKLDYGFRMYFSHTSSRSIDWVESSDGVHWTQPIAALAPNDKSGWEHVVNRPVVLKRGDGFHMWYTGQSGRHSWIGYATSNDGKTWVCAGDKPVLSADCSWEKVAVMCPHVIWNETAGLFQLWYSGGEQFEPDAIGYATSADGRTWQKHPNNPIFTPNPGLAWEKDRVNGCQVVRDGDWYVMFYIGFRDPDHAQIGIARSRDGVTAWERLPANPIIRPSAGSWDADACYKPFAIYDDRGGRWMLWYNGRQGTKQEIGYASYQGRDLEFPP